MEQFGRDWAKCTDGERVAFCRAAASEAEHHAQAASMEMQELYASLAKQWRLLAIEIERHGTGKEAQSGIGPQTGQHNLS